MGGESLTGCAQVPLLTHFRGLAKASQRRHPFSLDRTRNKVVTFWDLVTLAPLLPRPTCPHLVPPCFPPCPSPLFIQSLRPCFLIEQLQRWAAHDSLLNLKSTGQIKASAVPRRQNKKLTKLQHFAGGVSFKQLTRLEQFKGSAPDQPMGSPSSRSTRKLEFGFLFGFSKDKPRKPSQQPDVPLTQKPNNGTLQKTTQMPFQSDQQNGARPF